MAWIVDETLFVSNQIKQKPINEKGREELLARSEVLELRLSEAKRKVNESTKILEISSQELSVIKTQAYMARERIIYDDIGATGLTIDPSGRLAEYLKELSEISSDEERNYYLDKRAIELRSKIDHLFNEIIRNTR
jgi:hypothetical protein